MGGKRKQTRRSVSVKRATYDRVKAFCEKNNVSMSQFVEARIADWLDKHGQLYGEQQPSA